MYTTQSRRTYDHRIKQAILETGIETSSLTSDPEINGAELDSTAGCRTPSWPTSELVTCDRSALIAEIDALRQRTALLAAVVGLLVAMLRTSKTRIDYQRFAEGEFKADLLRAIDRAQSGIAAEISASNRASLALEVPQLAPTPGRM